MGFSFSAPGRRFAINPHGENVGKLASPKKQISFRFLAPDCPTSENERLRFVKRNERLRDEGRGSLESSRVLNRRLRR
jgi:hypothetical protein